MDVRNGARWTIAPNEGPFRGGCSVPSRRVPESSLGEYLAIAKLLARSPGKRIDEVIACKGAVWEKLLQPLLLAALNTDPASGSAELASAVIRESLARGGHAYRPRIASPTLGAAFIDPALAFLKIKGASVTFGARLRGVGFDGNRIASARFRGWAGRVVADDRVVLATPAWVTKDLMPDISAPTEFRSIVNAHFAMPAPAGASLMTGVIGGTAEWVFAFPDRLSVTVSGADAIVDQDREALANLLWKDVAAVHRLGQSFRPGRSSKSAGHICGDARTGQNARGRRDTLDEPVPCGRLDGHGPSRHNRRRGPVGRESGRAGVAMTDSEWTGV